MSARKLNYPDFFTDIFKSFNLFYEDFPLILDYEFK